MQLADGCVEERTLCPARRPDNMKIAHSVTPAQMSSVLHNELHASDGVQAREQ